MYLGPTPAACGLAVYLLLIALWGFDLKSNMCFLFCLFVNSELVWVDVDLHVLYKGMFLNIVGKGSEFTVFLMLYLLGIHWIWRTCWQTSIEENRFSFFVSYFSQNS